MQRYTILSRIMTLFRVAVGLSVVSVVCTPLGYIMTKYSVPNSDLRSSGSCVTRIGLVSWPLAVSAFFTNVVLGVINA